MLHRTYRIWRLDRRPSTCKYCRQAVVWAVTDEGRKIPLNAHERPIHQEKDERRQITFDVFAGDASHLWTCTARPKGPKAPRELSPFCTCTHRRGEHVDGRGACVREACTCRTFKPAPRHAPRGLF